MSTHDPHRVADLQAKIEEKSGQGGTKSPEEMQAEIRAKHAAAQAQSGYAADPPSPPTLWDPHPRGPVTVEDEPQHELGAIRGKAAKIIEEVMQTGEPIFILRAKDIFSVMGVAAYLGQVEQFGPQAFELVRSGSEQLEVMRQWQIDHVGQVRYPD